MDENINGKTEGPEDNDGAQSGTAKLRLILDVSYALNGALAQAMAGRLLNVVELSVGEGLLTGDTPAEVNEHSVAVTILPEELSQASVAGIFYPKVVVLCMNEAAVPVFHTCTPAVTKQQLSDGEHFALAIENAEFNGFGGPMIPFDATALAASQLSDVQGWLSAAAVKAAGPDTPHDPDLRPIIFSGGQKSLSDDDLCARCSNCDYRPGEMSGCKVNWPGLEDPDGYVQQCAEFARSET